MIYRSKSKYHATKIQTQDGMFDSKKEYQRWQILRMFEKNGSISNLQRQVKYELLPSQRDANGKAVRPVTYIADFVYTRDGETVVEDVKGYRTKEYIIKKKMMLYKYGITIEEV